MTRAKSQKKKRGKSRLSPAGSNHKLPFIEHLYELRRRVFYVAVSVVAWSVAAYFVQMHIVAVLLKPAENQSFIYTSPGGGLDFLVRICLYTGIALSIPVIVYQLLSYLRPLIKQEATRFMIWASVASGVLALLGVAFGYFVGLPAALHFLLNQFSNDQIRALLTIQSYMSFVTVYLLGSALLFQIPLILVLINRIKPLQPKKLLRFERWVILLSFVIAAIINPSPRIIDQLLLAGPMILAYQIGIFLVWRANRKPRASIADLLQKDEETRLARQAKFAEAQAALRAKQAAAPMVPDLAVPAPAAPQKSARALSPAVPLTEVRTAAPVRAQPATAQRRFVNDFTRRPAGYTPLRRPATPDTAEA